MLDLLGPDVVAPLEVRVPPQLTKITGDTKADEDFFSQATFCLLDLSLTHPSRMKRLSVGQSNKTSNALISASVGRPGISAGGGKSGGPWVIELA